MKWTEAKNERRCELIDKEIAGTLGREGSEELATLQEEMLAYRREVAPLPIAEIRELRERLGAR